MRLGRQDTQHNDTQHNDTQHNVTKHNDTQQNDTKYHNDTKHNDTHHNDTHHNGCNCDTTESFKQKSSLIDIIFATKISVDLFRAAPYMLVLVIHIDIREYIHRMLIDPACLPCFGEEVMLLATS
jgi:hypothetical protein